MARTRVYIDGFNLYHGLILRSRTHWLNLSTFAQRLNWGLPIEKILYCTANVSGTSSDSGKADRQDGYIRALSIACPNVEVIRGNFVSQPKQYPLARCSNDPACLVKVVVKTEKGSDVNLATRLLHDAHLDRFDRAIVVSGDSDLVEPIRIITQELKRVVWVRNPRDVRSKELAQYASHYEPIRPAVALNSQLPDVVTDGNRTYLKPERWKKPSVPHVKQSISKWTCAQEGCGNFIVSCRYEPVIP